MQVNICVGRRVHAELISCQSLEQCARRESDAYLMTSDDDDTFLAVVQENATLYLREEQDGSSEVLAMHRRDVDGSA